MRVVRTVTRPEGNRRAAESPEAARRGAAAEDITITYLAGTLLPPVPSSFSPLVRRPSYAHVRARVVCVWCVEGVCVRVCVPGTCVGAGEEACGRRRGNERERKQPGLLQTEEI